MQSIRNLTNFQEVSLIFKSGVFYSTAQLQHADLAAARAECDDVVENVRLDLEQDLGPVVLDDARISDLRNVGKGGVGEEEDGI